MIEMTQRLPPGPSRTAGALLRCGPGSPLAGSDRIDCDIGEEQLKLVAGAHRVGGLETLLELVDIEPTVRGGVAQRLDGLLALGV